MKWKYHLSSLSRCLYDILLRRWRRFTEVTVNFSCLMTMMVLLLTFLYLISSPLSSALPCWVCLHALIYYDSLWIFTEWKNYSRVLFFVFVSASLSRLLKLKMMKGIRKHTGDDRCQLSKEFFSKGMFALKIDGLLRVMGKLLV